jgi:hypothetical protein
MVLLALAIAPFGAASAVFSASTPKPPMRLLDLVKRRGTVAGPVLNTSFPDPGLILPDGRPPWYVCTPSIYDGIYRQKLSTDYRAHVAMNIYLYLMNIYSYLRYMNLSGER